MPCEFPIEMWNFSKNILALNFTVFDPVDLSYLHQNMYGMYCIHDEHLGLPWKACWNDFAIVMYRNVTHVWMAAALHTGGKS